MVIPRRTFDESASSFDHLPTHLENREPNTLHHVADQKQILKGFQAGDERWYIQECDWDQMVLFIKRLDENLQADKYSEAVRFQNIPFDPLLEPHICLYSPMR